MHAYVLRSLCATLKVQQYYYYDILGSYKRPCGRQRELAIDINCRLIT